MNFPLPVDQHSALIAEIVELTGERYTLESQLQWIANRIEALQLQIYDLHSSEV